MIWFTLMNSQRIKNEEFYSAMSEDALATILDDKVLLSSELIRNTYKHCENLQVNGSIKRKKLNK